MTREQRIRRTILVASIIFVVGVIVLASVDVEEESRQGAATAVAIVIGAYVLRQRQLWRQAED